MWGLRDRKSQFSQSNKGSEEKRAVVSMDGPRRLGPGPCAHHFSPITTLEHLSLLDRYGPGKGASTKSKVMLLELELNFMDSGSSVKCPGVEPPAVLSF